jgi:hypothetical protein
MGENLAVMAMLPMQTSPEVGGGDLGSLTAGKRSKKEDRIPQWSYHETKEFIAVRAELEKDFTQTKRNKTLWELIAAKMKEKGFRRSADQCKCKWKNLVNRYKGKETFDPDYEVHLISLFVFTIYSQGLVICEIVSLFLCESTLSTFSMLRCDCIPMAAG